MAASTGTPKPGTIRPRSATPTMSAASSPSPPPPASGASAWGGLGRLSPPVGNVPVVHVAGGLSVAEGLAAGPSGGNDWSSRFTQSPFPQAASSPTAAATASLPQGGPGSPVAAAAPSGTSPEPHGSGPRQLRRAQSAYPKGRASLTGQGLVGGVPFADVALLGSDADAVEVADETESRNTIGAALPRTPQRRRRSVRQPAPVSADGTPTFGSIASERKLFAGEDSPLFGKSLTITKKPASATRSGRLLAVRAEQRRALSTSKSASSHRARTAAGGAARRPLVRTESFRSGSASASGSATGRSDSSAGGRSRTASGAGGGRTRVDSEHRYGSGAEGGVGAGDPGGDASFTSGSASHRALPMAYGRRRPRLEVLPPELTRTVATANARYRAALQLSHGTACSGHASAGRGAGHEGARMPPAYFKRVNERIDVGLQARGWSKVQVGHSDKWVRAPVAFEGPLTPRRILRNEVALGGAQSRPGSRAKTPAPHAAKPQVAPGVDLDHHDEADDPSQRGASKAERAVQRRIEDVRQHVSDTYIDNMPMFTDRAAFGEFYWRVMAEVKPQPNFNAGRKGKRKKGNYKGRGRGKSKGRTSGGRTGQRSGDRSRVLLVPRKAGRAPMLWESAPAPEVDRGAQPSGIMQLGVGGDTPVSKLEKVKSNISLMGRWDKYRARAENERWQMRHVVREVMAIRRQDEEEARDNARREEHAGEARERHLHNASSRLLFTVEDGVAQSRNPARKYLPHKPWKHGTTQAAVDEGGDGGNGEEGGDGDAGVALADDLEGDDSVELTI